MVLTYVNPLNRDHKGEYIYEFIFSKDKKINFGDNWDVTPASLELITPPPIDDISSVGILKTKEPFELAINSDGYSMYDCVENIIAICWEKESPEYFDRLVFHFGENKDDVVDKLYSRDYILKFS